MLCFKHLRNVWADGIADDFSEHMKNIFVQNNDAFDSKLRMHCDLAGAARAIDKQFSLTANCPKGKGDMLRLWMIKHHCGALLWHVFHLNGSRQDAAIEASACFYWNRGYCVQYLIESA